MYSSFTLSLSVTKPTEYDFHVFYLRITLLFNILFYYITTGQIYVECANTNYASMQTAFFSPIQKAPPRFKTGSLRLRFSGAIKTVKY